MTVSTQLATSYVGGGYGTVSLSTHDETRNHIFLCSIYPSSKSRAFEYLRLTSVGVVGALVRTIVRSWLVFWCRQNNPVVFADYGMRYRIVEDGCQKLLMDELRTVLRGVGGSVKHGSTVGGVATGQFEIIERCGAMLLEIERQFASKGSVTPDPTWTIETCDTFLHIETMQAQNDVWPNCWSICLIVLNKREEEFAS
jgi:hypothetical protein